MLITTLLALQGAALLLVLARLAAGRTRRPPVEPRPEGLNDTSVSVIVPTYNEAARVGRCLAGLAVQGAPLEEIIVVDSRSTDGTDAVVREASMRDPRIRLVNDPPLPEGWVGKVWALQHGLSHATGEWVLGVDADTDPQPGMVAAVVAAARDARCDVVSFSPRFAGMTVAEQWVQPSMLVSLVYRTGAAGVRRPDPDKVLANGQCFLARREVLLAHGGYEAARLSWADDVTLARSLARRGIAVDFLDGSKLYDVRAYTSAAHMWREWGRSFDLSDATTRARQWLDVAFVMLVQGLPAPLLLLAATGAINVFSGAGQALLWLNVAVFAIRLLMLGALKASYAEHSVGYWLSPLADPLAALRLVLSTLKRPRQWRGRQMTTPARED
ncbi:MAG: glycosyltransferase [Cytophagaceae bacterium]|nr:glycosyltransferase [Gemmatimonadaceae bacterium]